VVTVMVVAAAAVAVAVAVVVEGLFGDLLGNCVVDCEEIVVDCVGIVLGLWGL